MTTPRSPRSQSLLICSRTRTRLKHASQTLPNRDLSRLIQLSIRLTLLLLLQRRLSLGLPSQCEIVPILDRDALGHMIDFVDPNEPLGEFEHVVP